VSKTFSYKRESTSSTTAFVAAARAVVAVVSVGRDSPYGHPHAEVLRRWRTSPHDRRRGTITVSTDGDDLKVETFVEP
jgi:competence protein ComEC